MDSQETANNMAEPTSGHGETMVKPNAPLPPQGFQARPQGPPPSPRNSINNGPVGAPRPGPPLRRLDSRSSLGPPPASGQFVQLRPYGPPRPPGVSFALRPPQPGQLPPQNPASHPPNQRFPYSPGIRGPPPPLQGAGGQRPPFVGNQQPYQQGQQQAQQQQQQQQRGNNDPRFQRPDGPQRRPSQESVFPRQLSRNDSSLSLQRQQSLPNEETKQPIRPRIVIEKMADINETGVDVNKPEAYLLRKKSDLRENDDDDDDDNDVVMDNEKSPRHNGDGGPETLLNGSKSPLIPRKLDDMVKPASQPDTATIESVSKPATRPGTASNDDKREKLEDIFSRPISASKETTDNTATFQNRPFSAVNDDKNERKEEKLASRPPSSIDTVKHSPENFARGESRPLSAASMSEEFKRFNSPYNNDALGGLKTPEKSSQENSRSATPSHLDTLRHAEQEPRSPSLRSPDKSRSVTPAHLDTPRHAEQEERSPSKSPDKSRSGTSAGSAEPPGSREAESTTPESKSPDKSRASTPASQLTPSPNAEREMPKVAPDRSRSVTPGGMESANEEKSSENSPRPDKSGQSASQARESGRTASPLSSSNLTIDKSPRSSPTVPGSATSPPKSPTSIKGFDNGQQRSLSSSPRSAITPRSIGDSGKQTAEDDKKQTSFVEDPVAGRKITDEPSTATVTSKPIVAAIKTPRAQTPAKPDDEKADRKSAAKKAIQNGESQMNATTNGIAESPIKKSPSTSKDSDKRSSTAGSPTKSPSKSAKSLPRTPDTPPSTAQEKKKVPMNKVQVGAAPSPNLKTVRSKIGSLDNASYKPGGGKVKIENRKLDFGSKAQSKIAAKNDKYMPSGGDKKINQVKLQWNAKSKVGSLENSTYKPGGGDKKIETVKLDFKDKAKSKVGSKDNAKHVPGGGAVKSATSPKTPQETKNNIPTQKLDIKAESKIGSLDNMKYKPGGGDKKIFNDRDYLRQTSSNMESLDGSGSQVQTSAESDRQLPNGSKTRDEIPQPQVPPSTPTKVRSVTSPSSIVTPQAVRSGLARSPEATTPRRQLAQVTEGSILANGRTSKIPSPDAANDKGIPPKGRSPRSPISPRPPNSLRIRSAGDKSTPGTPKRTNTPGTPNKTFPGTPRQTPSPKELRLPKLASSPTQQEASRASASETHLKKVTLPQLIEPSSQSARMAY